MRTIRTLVAGILVAALVGAGGVLAPQVDAHGEKAQESFLRQRTVAWWDVTWSADRIKVGETMTVTGKFKILDNWPRMLADPEEIFLNIAVPAPQMIREEAYINGVPFVNATNYGVKVGDVYEFKVVMRARRPGRYHLHTMLSIKESGPIVGPAHWITIDPAPGVFKNERRLLNGKTVDLETYNTGRVYGWSALWFVLAIGWIGYWTRRPLLARLRAVEMGAEEGLISPADRKMGLVVALIALLLPIAGYLQTTTAYPITIPLQTPPKHVEPLKLPPPFVDAKVESALYSVPTRTATLDISVKNNASTPVSLHEWATAGIRFIDPRFVPEGLTECTDMDNPYDCYIPMKVDPAGPLQPGESRTIRASITSPVWDIQRLMPLWQGTDNRLGGILMFYDGQGNRSIAEASAVVDPDFGI